VAEITLQRPGIVPLVRQRETAGMAQHVRVRLEAEIGGLTEPFYHPSNAGSGERRAALGREHERGFRVLLALQPAQCPQFVAADRMRGRRAFLDPTDGQGGRFEVDLIPLQVDQLAGAEAM
jgi:hypothetical protein